MKYSSIQMLERKNSYEKASILLNAMNDYSYGQNLKDNLRIIDVYCSDYMNDLLLPSGNVGTPLALALETHNFTTAKYIIDNQDRFDISLSEVALDEENQKVINLGEELDLALSYFNEGFERKNIEFHKRVFGEEAYNVQLARFENQVQAINSIKAMVSSPIKK